VVATKQKARRGLHTGLEVGVKRALPTEPVKA